MRKALLIAILALFLGGLSVPRLVAQTFTLTAKSSGSPTPLVTTAIAAQVTVKQTLEGGLVPFYVVDETQGGSRVLVSPGATYTFINTGGFPTGTTLGSIQPTVTGTYTYTVVQSGSPVVPKTKICPEAQAVSAINEDGSVSCMVVATSAPVASVFARIGNVTAQTGDYTVAQVTGAEAMANKGVANGYAGLDSGSKIAHSALPTLVSGDIPNNGANTSGTAATATALAGSPTQCTGNNFATGIATSGNANCAQPSAANVSGLAASATTDTTNASNISTGTLASARGGSNGISQGKYFATFCGGLTAEGLVGDVGWYSDLGGGVGKIFRTAYSKPDANHICNLDLISNTSGQQTGTGLAYCGGNTASTACADFQSSEVFPAINSQIFDFTWVFKFQSDTVSLLQRTQNNACSSGASTCNVTITSTTAGSALVCFANTVSSVGAATVLTNCTDSGDTFSSCASLGGTACIAQDATAANSNGLMVNLSGAGGKTTLTCTLSANTNAAWTCGVYEFKSNNGGVFSFDTSGNLVRTTSVSQPGVPLATNGPNGVVVQIIIPSTSLASSNFVGQGFVGNRDALASGEAYLPFSTSGYPTWTLGTTGRATESALALTVANGNTAITNITVCAALLNIASNFVTGALGSSCDQAAVRQAAFLRYSTNTSDTHWNFVACGASACTTSDSGVVPVPGNWVCFRLRSTTPGTLLYSVGQNATSGCSSMSSETSIATNLPTVVLSPWFTVTTFDAFWKHLVVNEFFGNWNNATTAP